MNKESIEVSETELVATGLLVGCVGAVVGGWTTGHFSTSGNMADWIAALGGTAAAVGTFAIGIGANRYAREAHLQRLGENARHERLRLEAKSRVLNGIRTKLRLAFTMSAAFKEQPEFKAEGPLHIPKIQNSFKAATWAVLNISWSPDEASALDMKSQNELIDLNLDMPRLGLLLEAFKENGMQMSRTLRRDVDTLQDMLNDIRTGSEGLLATVSAEIDRLQISINAHD